MNDLIESIATHKEIAIFVIGLLLIIGAITKGGISLGSFEIPKMETGQAKLLGGLGSSLILVALYIVLQPQEENNPPIASNYSKTITKGEVLIIPILDYVVDKDKADTLNISIVDDADFGITSLIKNKIRYVGTKVEDDLIIYQVSDGNGGRDTAEVKIRVKAPPAIMVNKRGKLINIYGQPKDGEYEIDLDNEIGSTPSKSIMANGVGEFDLRTRDENKRCKIMVQEKETDFYLDYKDEIKIVEYNPIDSIAIIFCRGYEKTEEVRQPIEVFKNRFNIPFDRLDVDSIATFQYGILHLGIKFFGSNKIEEKGKLDFNFIQQNRDKMIYTPVKLTSGSMAASTSGWNSNLKKKLLRGEYELEVRSQNGTLLKSIEFEIR